MFAKNFSAFFTLVLLSGSGLFVLAADLLPPQNCAPGQTKDVVGETKSKTLNCVQALGLQDSKFSVARDTKEVCGASRRYDCYNNRKTNYNLDIEDCRDLAGDLRKNAATSFTVKPGYPAMWSHRSCAVWFNIQDYDHDYTYCFSDLADDVENIAGNGYSCRSYGGTASPGGGSPWYVSIAGTDPYQNN